MWFDAVDAGHHPVSARPGTGKQRVAALFYAAREAVSNAVRIT